MLSVLPGVRLFAIKDFRVKLSCGTSCSHFFLCGERRANEVSHSRCTTLSCPIERSRNASFGLRQQTNVLTIQSECRWLLKASAKYVDSCFFFLLFVFALASFYGQVLWDGRRRSSSSGSRACPSISNAFGISAMTTGAASTRK